VIGPSEDVEELIRAIEESIFDEDIRNQVQHSIAYHDISTACAFLRQAIAYRDESAQQAHYMVEALNHEVQKRDERLSVAVEALKGIMAVVGMSTLQHKIAREVLAKIGEK
jgi:hypothetical protein